MVKQFQKGFYHLSKADSVAKITPTIDIVSTGPADKVTVANDGIEWVKWGKDDDIAIQMLNLCWDSPSKPRLMDTAKEFILGAGVRLMSTEIEGGKEVRNLIKHPELRSWFRENQVYSDFLELAALSLTFAEMA
ncbi:hypothetical protein, partial [Dyadobacter sp.]|uniref:hypothetical protein n=1 Tax=Dyadobacter sp. TaxID=1914288 RepID=UPI003F6F2CD4